MTTQTTPPLTHRVLAARFQKKVAPPWQNGLGCWFWTGGLTSGGYGAFALTHDDINHAHGLSLATATVWGCAGRCGRCTPATKPPASGPNHLRIGTAPGHRFDQLARNRTRDRRGARGRAEAIRAAIGDANADHRRASLRCKQPPSH